MNIPAILYNNADFDSILGAEIIERYYKEENTDIPAEKQLKFIMSNLSLDDYKKIVEDYDVIIIIGISKIYNIFNEVFNIIKDKDYYIFECNPMFTNYLKKKKLDNKQIFVKTDESKALQVFNLIKNPLKFINFDTTYSELKYFSDGYTCNYEMNEDSDLTNIAPEDCLREKYYYIYNKQDETVASYFTSYYLYNNEETRTSNGLKKDNTADQNIRYYGSDPNNYVSFNNELWRIIGVFGNNVKLIRSEKLGDLSWDSSEASVNSGYGVNE